MASDSTRLRFLLLVGAEEREVEGASGFTVFRVERREAAMLPWAALARDFLGDGGGGMGPGDPRSLDESDSDSVSEGVLKRFEEDPGRSGVLALTSVIRVA
jgi:hypothetical protein